MIAIQDVENLQLKLHKYQTSFRESNDCLFGYGTPKKRFLDVLGINKDLLTDILLVTPDQI